ncbi:hypothetical protein V6N13_035950 [Hibiscus sabdariffa]
MSLGLRMVQLLTATLVHGFDWELGDRLLAEKLNMEEAPGLTLHRVAPLMVLPRHGSRERRAQSSFSGYLA